MPDITFLFVGDFDNAIKRAEKRDKQKYTKKEMEILSKSDYWFRKLLPKFRKRKVYIIDVDKTKKDDIIKEIKKILDI